MNSFRTCNFELRLVIVILILTFAHCNLAYGLLSSLGLSKGKKEENILPLLGALLFLSASESKGKGCSSLELPESKWSEPSTWSGVKPVQGQLVKIPSNKRILLDESPPSLNGIEIDGILEFADKDIQLTTKYIMIHGQMKIGSKGKPFSNNAKVQLTGLPNENVMNMGTRGIMVMGGCLEMHGPSPEIIWTKISQSANTGSSNLQVLSHSGWKVGDEIVVAPTDYYQAGPAGNSISQKVSLTSINNNQIGISSGLNAHRYGELQYPLTVAPYLTTNPNSNNRITTPPAPDTADKITPLVLDERAEIAHITRNIVIESIDDQNWQSQGFGAHIMIMKGKAAAFLDGVEIRRAGQRGIKGRYPFHWHMLSYSGSETLDDATGQYIQNSSIHNSQNRGIVIHGTNGVTVRRNVVFDIRGHGIFTEDAVERRNTIDENIVLHVRDSSQPLKIHEGANGSERGSSCFWISNPDNTVTNNVAADCRSNGYWLAFTFQPWGESSAVVDKRDGQILNPSRLEFGKFDNNTAHSNLFEGINLDLVENDNNGNIIGHQYFSTTTGRNITYPANMLRRFALSNLKVWKNGKNGIWDRAANPDNYGIVSADNCGRFFAGSGANGIIERSLVIGTSLNHMLNGSVRVCSGDIIPGVAPANTPPVAFATYHSAFDIKDNIAINFPATSGVRSGVFATDDYYIRALEKGQIRNQNNLIINSHPGVKLPSGFNYFTLASAMWDPYGTWTGIENLNSKTGNYIVYNDPFITHGKSVVTLPNHTGAVSVAGPFYAYEGFILHGIGNSYPYNQEYDDLWGISIERLNLIDRSQINGGLFWTVTQGQPGALLAHMRDFVTSPDSAYRLSFQHNGNDEIPSNFRMIVEGFTDVSDTQVIGIRFNPSIPVGVALISRQTYLYSSVNSYELLRDSPGETYWQDNTNGYVWVKIRGGRWQHWTEDLTLPPASYDDLLYHTVRLRIYPLSIGLNPF